MKTITYIALVFLFLNAIKTSSQETWSKLGSDVSDNTAAHSNTAIDSNGIPYTVLIEGGGSGVGFANELTCKKFVDGEWVLVGDRGFSNVAAKRGYPSILVDQQNNIVVGHVMGDTYEARAYMFTNNAWTELGTGISAGPSSFVNVATDSQGDLYTAYCAGNSGGVVTVKKWNSVSESWDAVGAAVSAGNANYLRFVVDENNTPIVAYADASADNRLSVKKWNSSTDSWEYVGSQGFSSHIIPLETATPKVNSYVGLGVDSYNVIFVAYRSLSSGKPIVESFSVDSWAVVETVTTAAETSTIDCVDFKIGMNNTPYLTYRDNLSSPVTYSAVVQKLVSNEWIPIKSVNGIAGTQNNYCRIAVDRNNKKLYSTIATGNKTQVYSISDSGITTVNNVNTYKNDIKVVKHANGVLLSNLDEGKLTIFTVSGVLLKQIDVTNTLVDIEISNGIYIVQNNNRRFKLLLN